MVGADAVRFRVGVDIGSTTVKAVVVDAHTDAVLWKDYRRHDTRQPEMVLDFLTRMEAEAGIGPDNCRMFVTGTGGTVMAELVGGRFVQEALATSLSAERPPIRRR